MNLLPYVTLVVGILSFGIWWWSYLQEAKNPDGKPPNMWIVSGIHALFILVGFLSPFFLDPDEQKAIFIAVVGVSLFVLVISILAGIRRAFFK
jgi:hypothetical protein